MQFSLLALFIFVICVIPQYSHKGAPHHGQSAWKKLFGLHRVSQSKHAFIPVRFFTASTAIEPASH